MILLDTHTLIWLDQGLDLLGEKARQTIEAAWRQDEVGFCTASIWEISQLVAANRLSYEGDLSEWRASLLSNGFTELMPSGQVVISAAGLRSFNGDDVDRILAAMAAAEDAPLVTADSFLLRRRSVPTIDARQ